MSRKYSAKGDYGREEKLKSKIFMGLKRYQKIKAKKSLFKLVFLLLEGVLK